MHRIPLAVVVCVVFLSVAAAGSVLGTTLLSDGTSTAQDSELPPGVTEDGVENETALVAAHTAAVNESGFVYQTRTSYNLSSAGMTGDSTETGVVGAGLSSFRIHSTGTTTIENCTVEFAAEQWGNESVLLLRYEIGNQTEYVKQNLTRSAGGSPLGPTPDPVPDEGLTQSRLVAAVLQSGNFTVAETATVGDRTLTTLRAVELDESAAGQLGDANVSRYGATITVDDRGLVQSLNLTASAERGDRQFHLDYSFDVLALGPDDPLRPAWTPTALDTVSAALSIDDADDHFEISNRAGDAVPANTTIELTHRNATHDLTLDEELAPGETVYAYYPTNESSPVLDREPPANDTAQELAGAYEFVVRTPSEQVLLSVEFEIGDGTSASYSGGSTNPFAHCEEFDGGAFSEMASLESEALSR